MIDSRIKIIFLSPGPVPLPEDPKKNRFNFLSRYFSGAVFSTHWGEPSQETLQSVYRSDKACGEFRYEPYLLSGVGSRLTSLIISFKFLIKSLSYKQPDLIVSYGAYRTGLIAWLVSRLKRIPFAIELSGNPAGAFRFEGGHFRARLSLALARFVCKRAAVVHALYPEQVEMLSLPPSVRIEVFHGFTSLFKHSSEEKRKKEILFVGHPWFLKGVDLLISAFNNVKAEFPEYRLKIVGHCEDRTLFEKIAQGDERIEFFPGQKSDVIKTMMESASLFVLPSRTEAMGRVLLEAMSCGLPVVASRVDGIPFYVEDGKMGLLFEPGNVSDLTEKLRAALSDDQERLVRAEYAQRVVREKYSEFEYSRLMCKAIKVAIQKD